MASGLNGFRYIDFNNFSMTSGKPFAIVVLVVCRRIRAGANIHRVAGCA